MLRDTKKLTQGTYDLLVVGAGINGAAISHLAAKEGFKVALVDKGDFASGTSSKSTKLLHGGIRYLEQGEFNLVKESLLERYIQWHSAPHLVQLIPFIIPVYKNDKRPLWLIKFGVWLYDFLSGRYSLGERRNLTVEQIKNLEPHLKNEDLLGGVLYYDAQMDDTRLCLENILSAAEYSATVANYVEMKEILRENGRAVGAVVVDRLTHQRLIVKAKTIVCTVGPWANEVLMMDAAQTPGKLRLTKGIHLVYEDKLSEHAIAMTSQSGQRIIFVIPWENHSLIGTTDTDFAGYADDVRVEPQDIDYLLKETGRYFPQIKLSSEKILSTYVGLRPLLKAEGHPSELSREHRIVRTFSGVCFVLGGKYTTYRQVAYDCLSQVTGKSFFIKKKQADDFSVYGSGTIKELPLDVANHFDLPEETVKYLMDQYGTKYQDVLALIKRAPQFKHPICSCSLAIGAQVLYSKEVEMAQNKEDVIWRRLGIGYFGCKEKRCEHFIAACLS